MRNLYEGLGVLLKYGDDEVAVEHDVIYAGPNNLEKVSVEDQIKLKELGWYWSEDYDCWEYFV